ncbi:hypothetical protein K3495_g6311 [Podosphaera aphanis]|nr:hypothetical protein K3495_g6311 [Podosphaera aphanis]
MTKSRKKIQSDVRREGASDIHRLFGRETDNGPVALYLDNGTTSCYIERDVVDESSLFPTQDPVALKGVCGGQSTIIRYDVLIKLRLRLSDGIFPALLTLGKSMLHRLGVYHISGTRDISLRSLPNSPILKPPNISPIYSAATAWTNCSHPQKFPHKHLNVKPLIFPTLSTNDTLKIKITTQKPEADFSEPF